MNLKESRYEEFERIANKEGTTFASKAEMKAAADNLVRFLDHLSQMDQEEKARERRLETEPHGFLVDKGAYSCPLCGHWSSDGVWYDKWGVKCLACQDALNKKIVPGYIFKDYRNERHITGSTLSHRYDIHTSTLRKLIRREKLRVREMPIGTLVFLRSENPDIIAVIEEEKGFC